MVDSGDGSVSCSRRKKILSKMRHFAEKFSALFVERLEKNWLNFIKWRKSKIHFVFHHLILYARKLSDGTVSETSLCVHLGEKFIE